MCTRRLTVILALYTYTFAISYETSLNRILRSFSSNLHAVREYSQLTTYEHESVTIIDIDRMEEQLIISTLANT